MLAAMALTAHAERSDHRHAVYLSDQLFKGMRQDSDHGVRVVDDFWYPLEQVADAHRYVDTGQKKDTSSSL